MLVIKQAASVFKKRRAALPQALALLSLQVQHIQEGLVALRRCPRPCMHTHTHSHTHFHALVPWYRHLYSVSDHIIGFSLVCKHSHSSKNAAFAEAAAIAKCEAKPHTSTMKSCSSKWPL